MMRLTGWTCEIDIENGKKDRRWHRLRVKLFTELFEVFSQQGLFWCFV